MNLFFAGKKKTREIPGEKYEVPKSKIRTIGKKKKMGKQKAIANPKRTRSPELSIQHT